jgi:hypothetical protein
MLSNFPKILQLGSVKIGVRFQTWVLQSLGSNHDWVAPHGMCPNWDWNGMGKRPMSSRDVHLKGRGLRNALPSISGRETDLTPQSVKLSPGQSQHSATLPTLSTPELLRGRAGNET